MTLLCKLNKKEKALMSKYFSLNELKCKCGKCGSTGEEMDVEFMNELDKLREKVGPLVLPSAYRCPEYNSKVSSTGLNGPHTTGKSADISCRGQHAFVVLWQAMNLGFTGIGINQKGNARFIHLDMLTSPQYPRPNVWSY